MMNEIETFTLMALASEIRKAMKKKKQQTQPQTQSKQSLTLISLLHIFVPLSLFFSIRYSFLRSPAVTVSNDYARFGMLLHYEIGWALLFAVCLLSCVFGSSSFHFLKNHTSGEHFGEIHGGCVCVCVFVPRLWNDTAFHSSTKAIRIERNVRRKKSAKKWMCPSRINVLWLIIWSQFRKNVVRALVTSFWALGKYY